MNKKTKDSYQLRADVIKALAHPSRLYMVEMLAKNDRCVCQLTEAVGADVSTVSKHLLILKKAGIVKTEKSGAKVFYSLRTPCVLNFLDCVEAVVKSSQRLRACAAK